MPPVPTVPCTSSSERYSARTSKGEVGERKGRDDVSSPLSTPRSPATSTVPRRTETCSQASARPSGSVRGRAVSIRAELAEIGCWVVEAARVVVVSGQTTSRATSQRPPFRTNHLRPRSTNLAAHAHNAALHFSSTIVFHVTRRFRWDRTGSACLMHGRHEAVGSARHVGLRDCGIILSGRGISCLRSMYSSDIHLRRRKRLKTFVRGSARKISSIEPILGSGPVTSWSPTLGRLLGPSADHGRVCG